MKNNQPVTSVESEFKDGSILASRTDLKGIITYANKAFIEISGFSKEELLGKNHNIVRHPDMPPQAFEDLWNTMKAEKPWTGIVKNRCKNGDYYWVKATVTPVIENGRIVEYMSVRVKPTQQEVAAAESLYRDLNAGKASLKPGLLGALWKKLQSQSIGRKLTIAYSLLLVLIVGVISYSGLKSLDHAMAESEAKELHEYHGMLGERLKGELRTASAMAALVAELPITQAAFAAGDRDALKELFLDAYKRLKREFGVAQFQFHQPPALSFLRLHKPKKFGDDLTSKRPTIVKTNADKQPVVGMDMGAYGLGLRGLTPVFKDGKHIGSVEFGMSFGEGFFTSFKEEHGVDVSLDLIRDGQLAPFASTLAKRLPVVPELVSKVKAGESAIYETELGNKPVGIMLAPLHDYAKNIVGVLQVVMDRSGFVEEHNALRNQSLVEAAIALLISIVVSILIARSITRPLHQAMSVAREITDGNYNNDIAVFGEDETGQVLLSMQTMQSRLAYDVHEVQEGLQANLRIRTALDNVQSPVTVSDRGNLLIYMNGSAHDLFDELGENIRKEGKSFNTDDLIGTSLADFLPDEKLRKAYKIQLAETRQSQLVAWGHTLDLVTSPVLDADGDYQGRVTQWTDISEKLVAEEQERERVDEERRIAAANLRLKVALDNVSSNVMVADAGHDVIYMNETAQTMFSDAEADIRKEISGFDAAGIVGSNIDIFHKNPAHQRSMLDRLSGTHKAGFEVGGHTMRFVANPVVDGEGKRLGTVVEWTDRTEEVAVEKEVDGIVESARNGDLSRRINTSGKSGFFLQLGQGINELISVVESVVKDIATVMNAMSDGDLTQPISADYEGTFGEVKESVNETIGKLESIVAQLLESSDVIATAADEISSGNNNLSQRTEQQASSLEETAASMEELTSTVRNNADNAQQANQVSTNARQLAEKGGDVVSNAVTAMSEINTSSNKIAEIIGVIDEIAFQTNLLALNASVEAARAGEQGRGFAVVATEVRNLASRSAEAAKEIKELIQDSVGKVQAGSELVNQSGDTLEEIVSGVKKVGDIIAEIAAASAEQSAGIDQVNNAVTSMDEVTQQNAALAEQTSAASASMTDKAREMEASVGFFKVSGRAASAPVRTQPAAPVAPQPRPAPAPSRPAPATPARAKSTVTPSKINKPADSNEEEWEEF